jgi:hypothetical protein
MNQQNHKMNKIQCMGAVVSFLVALSGCGKEAFNPSAVTQPQAAPGSFTIPPKVDILLVQDDTGSMLEPYEQISRDVKSFLSSLDSQSWDYHFTMAPLTTYRDITQVVGSVHDSNRGAYWKPAYPGQASNALGMIPTEFFRLPSTFTDYISRNSTTNVLNGLEPGLENIKKELISGTAQSQFIRPDATTIVLVVGNGNDTSGINFCKRFDGVTVPCDDGSVRNSLLQYESFFKSFNPGNLKFYAAVSAEQTDSCLNGRSFVGTRYHQIASSTGGESYNICRQTIGNVLTSLSQSLKSKKGDYRIQYLFFNQEPNPETLTVTRNINGDTSRTEVIPQDPNNGWSYVGYAQNVHAIDYPVAMNLGSGYAIKLNGTAKLSGADTVSMDYKLAGAQTVISK